MGNSIGNLKEYVDVFRTQRNSVGGCIWEYVDHNVWTKPKSVDVALEKGPYNIKGYLTGSIADNALTSGSYARFPNSAGANGKDVFNQHLSGSKPFSIEFWALPTASPANAAFVSKGDDQVAVKYSSTSTSSVLPGRIPGDMMKLVTAVTNSQSTNSAGEAPSNAANNNPNNKWCNTLATWPSSGVYLQYELSEPQVAKVFMLTSANDDMSYNRSLQNVRIQGSNNNSTWDTLTTVTGIVFTSNFQDRVFNFENETAYRYYRLCIDRTTNGTSGTFQLACFSLGTGVGFQLEPSNVNPKVSITIGGKSGNITATADVGMDFLYKMQRVAGVFNGTNLELWLNGALAASEPVPEGFEISESSNDMAVGYAQDRGFTSNSNIAGARVFSRALSDAELKDNARNPYDPASGEGILLWADFSQPTEKSPPPFNDVYGNGMYLGYGGDWGEGNHDNYFCSDGLLKSIREPEPEMREVKRIYQNLMFTASPADLAAGRINVRNEYYGTNGNAFDYVWTLYEDDTIIGKGTLANVPSIPPMTNELILVNIPTVPIEIPYLNSLPAVPKPGAEYFLNIQACLKEDKGWASIGYPLNEEQFKLNFRSEETLILYSNDFDAVAMAEDGDNIKISGKSFAVGFNKTSGAITDYTADGVQLISSGPQPTFFRALMANDRTGSTNWLNADITKTLESFTVTPVPGGKSVKIDVTYRLPAINNTSWVDMKYEVYGNGSVKITTALRTNITSNQMYRFGVDFTMPPGYENIDWYTRGPEENLNDRANGYNVGRYQTTATDNYWPYIKPQDTGTHQETRFMALTSDSEDKGLMVVATGSRLFEANALHYTWRDMNNGNHWWNTGVRHPYELKPRAETIVSVSYGSRGTGSESCMTNPPLAPYLLPAGNYTYTYTLVPFDKSEQAQLVDVSRYYRNADPIRDRFSATAVIASNAIRATFANNLTEGKSINAIAAVYNSNGVLVAVETQSIQVASYATANITFSGINVSQHAGCTYKVFAWDGGTMVPLCLAFEGQL